MISTPNKANVEMSRERNQLLATLPEAVWQRWSGVIEPIEMPLGLVLWEAGERIRHVYFPTTSIISLIYSLRSGAAAEVAVIGHEGLAGVAVITGGLSETYRAVVQSSGRGLRVPADFMAEESVGDRDVQKILLSFVQALFVQVGQTAICNRHHSVPQQLCRWLLLCLDRLQADEVAMTQQLISEMLGVRRESVTDHAMALQAEGIIEYVRGRITVLDRAKMEQRSCECYEVVASEYTRLLGTPRAVPT
jgi:CRP-like cAMP-binding protein